MPPLRAIASSSGPAPRRLREVFDARISEKCLSAARDPELFEAYRRLAADAQSAVAAHIQELIALAAAIIRSGIEEGSFRDVDPIRTSRAILFATSRFHHPAHAAEWANTPKMKAIYEDVWQMLMEGLCTGDSSDTETRGRGR